MKDSIRLLLVSLDIGATGIFLVFGKTLATAWLIRVKAESSLRDFVRWNANMKRVSESIASHR